MPRAGRAPDRSPRAARQDGHRDRLRPRRLPRASLLARGEPGIGFDPSHVPGRSEAAPGADLTFVQDYYSEAYSDEEADLICCRHALEHIERPGDFLRTVRRAIGERPTAVFFEVPNALFTLRDLGIWDIIYEHCGYFCAGSLREVFRRNGFAVDRVETEFGGQFLALHASPGVRDRRIGHAAILRSGGLVSRFADHYRAKVDGWRETLRRLRRDGSRTVLWGAGSKGVSFVNIAGGDGRDRLLDRPQPVQGRPLRSRYRAPGSLPGIPYRFQAGCRDRHEPALRR